MPGLTDRNNKPRHCDILGQNAINHNKFHMNLYLNETGSNTEVTAFYMKSEVSVEKYDCKLLVEAPS